MPPIVLPPLLSVLPLTPVTGPTGLIPANGLTASNAVDILGPALIPTTLIADDPALVVPRLTSHFVTPVVRGEHCIDSGVIAPRHPAAGQMLAARVHGAATAHIPATIFVDPTKPAVQEFCSKTQTEILPSDFHPAITEAYQTMTSMLRLLSKPRDGISPIHVVIADTMIPNACFVKMPSGERVICVNLGLLNELETDDELACILAHELEHGPSELHAHINELRGRGSAGDEVLSWGLQRAVEIEADVKGAVDRVHGAGFNPHAAEHYFDRRLVKYGDRISTSHPMDSARKHAVSIATTLAIRGLGVAILPDEPHCYRNETVGAVQTQILRTDDFKTRQREKFEAHLRTLDTVFDEAIGKIAAENVSYSPCFNSIASQHWQFCSRYLAGLFDEKDMLDYQVMLFTTLFDNFEEALASRFGDDITQLTAKQIHLLMAEYENRSLFVSIEGVGNTNHAERLCNVIADIANLKSERVTLQTQLNGTGDLTSQQRIAARIEALNCELAKHQKQYETLCLVFDDGAAQKAAACMQHKSRIADLERKSKEGGLNVAEIEELKTAKGFWQEAYDWLVKHEVLGDLRERNIQRQHAIMRYGFYKMLAECDDADHIGHIVSTYLVDYPDLYADDPVGLVEMINTALIRTSRNSTMIARIAFWIVRHAYRNQKDHAKFQLLTKAVAQNPQRVAESFGKIVDHNLDALVSQHELVPVIHKSNDLVGTCPVYTDGICWHFSRELGSLILTPERVSRIVRQMANFSIDASNNAQQKYAQYSDQIGKKRLITVTIHNIGTLADQVQTLADYREILDSDYADIKEALDAAVGFIASLLDEADSESTRHKQALSFICAKLTEQQRAVYDHALNQTHSLRGIREGLESLAVHPQNTQRLKGFLSYSELFALVDDHDSPQAQQMFFEFAFCLRHLVLYDFRTRELPESKQRHHAYVTIAYARWLMKHHPEDSQTLLHVLHRDCFGGSKYLGYFVDKGNKIISELYLLTIKKHKHLPANVRIEEATYQFMRECPCVGFFRDREVVLEAVMPRSPLDKFKFILAAIKGADRAQAEIGFDVSKELLEALKKAIGTSGVCENAEIQDLVCAFEFLIEDSYGKGLPQTDKIFEAIMDRPLYWEVELGSLRSPKSIGKLLYDENKMRLALWQLESRFRLSVRGEQVRARPEQIPEKTGIRPIIREIRDYIDLQFPENTAVKNEVLEYVENALLTNPAETRFLSESKLTTDEWYKERRLVAIDMPHAINRGLQDHFERLQLIKYLIGYSEEHPSFSLPMNFGYVSQDEYAAKARRFFIQAGEHAQMYALQPMLDDRVGVLSSPELTNSLYDLILGKYAGDHRFKKIFLAYLNAVGNGQKRVVLGYILASMIGKKGRGASLRVILEAMGPLGIKAAQVLRTSGLVSKEIRDDLNDVFDHAMKPTRTEIFERAEVCLGPDYAGVVCFLDLLGSGSINFVIGAEMLTSEGAPTTETTPTAAIRMLRAHAGDRIRAENDVWIKAIAELVNDDDPEIVRLARMIDETRAHAMSTLSEGGIELNLAHEVGVYDQASTVYARPRDAAHQFEIAVVRPLQEYADHFRGHEHEMAIYEAIDCVPFDKITDEKLRRQIAREIIEAEFGALLGKTGFDPDGHPGNWLIDLKRRQLVRIDYAQFRTPSPFEMSSFKQALGLIIKPRLSRDDIKTLASVLPGIFTMSHTVADVERLLEKIVRDRDFPSMFTPHDRIFFIQQRLRDFGTQSAHPDFDVSLVDTTRAGLSSIARTRIYAEELGNAEYLKRLWANL